MLLDRFNTRFLKSRNGQVAQASRKQKKTYNMSFSLASGLNTTAWMQEVGQRMEQLPRRFKPVSFNETRTVEFSDQRWHGRAIK